MRHLEISIFFTQLLLPVPEQVLSLKTLLFKKFGFFLQLTFEACHFRVLAVKFGFRQYMLGKQFVLLGLKRLYERLTSLALFCCAIIHQLALLDLVILLGQRFPVLIFKLRQSSHLIV